MRRNANILLLAAALLSGCETFHDDWNNIEVINDSDVDIYVGPGHGGWWLHSYPTTGLPSNKPRLISVAKGTVGTIESGIKWQDIIKDMPKDTISFYFFNADTVDILPWKTVKDGYKVIKRTEYSLEDFEKSNWKIHFK